MIIRLIVQAIRTERSEVIENAAQTLPFFDFGLTGRGGAAALLAEYDAFANFFAGNLKVLLTLFPYFFARIMSNAREMSRESGSSRCASRNSVSASSGRSSFSSTRPRL